MTEPDRTGEVLVAPPLLAELAWQASRRRYLGSFHGSDIYQVSRGWQGAILERAGLVTLITRAAAFEAAVRQPDSRAIYVPYHAALTQEIAMRILQRNPLGKTIFWEIGD